VTLTPIRAALLLAASLAAAPAGARAPRPVPLPPPPDLRPRPPASLHAGDTRCSACHSTEQWGDVAFAHERTGFPLVGEHRKVGCKQCHPTSFSRAVTHDCSGCHRDVHRGQLGFRCQGCHDETSWKSRFGAEAHRRVGFPLTGRHAFLACEECHGDKLGRGFARSASTCFDCHQKDLARGNSVVSHATFGNDCKECHFPWKFANAFFPAHERCFPISAGPHMGIACAKCHAGSVPPLIATCYTPPLACADCHACGSHPAVLGFDVTICATPQLKCYDCHGGTAGVAGTRLLKTRSR
jgi:hypothetical protein